MRRATGELMENVLFPMRAVWELTGKRMHVRNVRLLVRRVVCSLCPSHARCRGAGSSSRSPYLGGRGVGTWSILAAYCRVVLTAFRSRTGKVGFAADFDRRERRVHDAPGEEGA